LNADSTIQRYRGVVAMLAVGEWATASAVLVVMAHNTPKLILVAVVLDPAVQIRARRAAQAASQLVIVARYPSR